MTFKYDKLRERRTCAFKRCDGPRVCRYVEGSAPVRSFHGLKRIMARNGFELRAQEDMPFVIREHARKFQWGCAHGTVWVQTGGE